MPDDPKYAWKGKVIKLTQENLDEWKKSYPHIEVEAALRAKDDELAEIGTEDEKKKWFFSTSMWLMAMNQTQARLERAAEKDAEHRERNWRRKNDPNRNDPFASQYAAQLEEFDRHKWEKN